MTRILKARYFADGNILTTVLKKKASYARKYLLNGRDLLKRGMRFLIGNGSTVSMWTDPWIPDHPPRSAQSPENNHTVESVRDYMLPDGSGWDVDKLRSKVIHEDVERILTLTISQRAELDLLGWHYTDNGIYTVKSGYWLSTHLPNNEMIAPIWGDPILKQKLWKCSSHPKAKHFLWKIMSRALPTGSNLKWRHVTTFDQCKRCCAAPETEKHMLFDCPYAKMIWRASGVSNVTINVATGTLEEKKNACITCNTTSGLSHLKDLPISILWRIWKSRNMLIFQQKTVPWWKVIQQAKFDV